MDDINDNDLRRIDKEIISSVCEQLRHYEGNIVAYIVDFVAALCCVSAKTMMSDNDKRMYAEPRWLVWFACRYITNGGFSKIASMTAPHGHKFTGNSVQKCAGKMSQMIDTIPLWNKRWRVLKSMIDIWDSERIAAKRERNRQERIVITIPKELKDIVKIEIKSI